MEKRISLQNKNVTYILRKSRRARRMRLAVYCDGSVIVTTPFDLQETVVEKFLRDKSAWLFSKLDFFRTFQGRPIVQSSHGSFVKYKNQALALVQSKIQHFNTHYGFRFKNIRIKNQKTRWGSCSKKGNLNFNYKILLLPEKLQDYLVVHELCHLKEFNHSRNFWVLVSQAVPDFRSARQELNTFGLSLN